MQTALDSPLPAFLLSVLPAPALGPALAHALAMLLPCPWPHNYPYPCPTLAPTPASAQYWCLLPNTWTPYKGFMIDTASLLCCAGP